MKIIVLGPPGTGKGTQAKLISKEYGIPHISTGDLFREHIAKGTALGKKANEFIKHGNFVPDDVTTEMLMSRLRKKDCEKGFILDGYPRNLEQAKILEKKGVKIDVVLNITSSDKLVIERLSGRRTCKKCDAIYHIKNLPPKKPGVCDKCSGQLYQREDDKPETIKYRLKVYKKQTEPLIDYYKKKGVLKNINGEKGIKKVFEEIKRVLG